MKCTCGCSLFRRMAIGVFMCVQCHKLQVPALHCEDCGERTPPDAVDCPNCQHNAEEAA